jgi:hypothetical protein
MGPELVAQKHTTFVTDFLEFWELQPPVMGLPYLYLISQFKFGCLTRHSTVRLFIPTLSKFHNAQCDFIIIYTSHNGTRSVQIFLEQSQSLITSAE